MSNTMYARLNKARQEFADARIEPSGINRHQQYTYFELEDIVPTARRVLTENDLMMTFQYTNGHACVELIDLSPEKSDKLQFVYEFFRSEAYKGMNDIQSFGADLKYLRRYCYLCVLDITEPDDINQLDNTPVNPAPIQSPVKAPEPKTEPKAEEKKSPAATPSTTNDATKEQKTELVAILKDLKRIDREQDEFVQEVLQSTNNLKKISEDKCLTLIKKVKEMLSEYEVK